MTVTSRHGFRLSGVKLKSYSPTPIIRVHKLELPVMSTRPNIAIREQNRTLLEATFLQSSFAEEDDDDCLEGPSMSMERRQEACEYLLSIDNDSWKSDKIIHWCKFGCCSSSKESKLKLWIAIQVGESLFLHKMKV